MANATCGYCYNYGHNKMGCPKAKERATEILPQWGAWQQMEHDNDYYKTSTYKAARHFGWDYKWREALDIHIQKQNRSTKVKVCNWCGDTGHNKRTCSSLKDFKATLKQGCIGYRKAVLNAISETGQGIGSMFSGEYNHWNSNTSEYESGNGLGLVTAIAWRAIELFDVREHGEIYINSTVSGNIFKVRWVHGETETTMPFVGYEVDGEKLLYVGWRGADKKLIAPSSKVNPPDGWAECEDEGFKKLLKSALSGRKSQKQSDFYSYDMEKIEKWK